jgi:general secretion pathway protein G
MTKPRSLAAGFTLIELLIVIAIVGLLAAMLIPNLLDALDKSKQKRTMADLRMVGTGMMSWLTDQNSAAAAGALVTANINVADFASVTVPQLETVLVPQYIQSLPVRDGWKNDYEYYLDIADPRAEHMMLIRSRGKLGAWDGSSYAPGAFDPTDYSQDLVWAEGVFIRFPQKVD